MEVIGSVSGCVLSFEVSDDGHSGTIRCTPGTVHFSSGYVCDVPACSAAVLLEATRRHTRAFITGAKGEHLPGSDEFISEPTKLSLQLDNEWHVARGAYPGGLVVLGHVELPATAAITVREETNDKKHLNSRAFLRWSEATKYLECDDEGLRQAIVLGSWRNLSAFVRADRRAFYATLSGNGIALNNGHEGVSLISRWDSDNPTQLTNGNTLDAWGEMDDFCSWEKQETSQGVTGYPAVYLLRGFFRVDPWCVKVAADEGLFDGVAVMPPSWWTHESIPKSNAGVPEISFALLKRKNWLPPPKHLSELWFRKEDVESLAKSNNKYDQCGEPSAFLKARDKPLATREKNNLLRIIRALVEMNNLPSKGYAESIRRQLENLNLNAPSDDTIRKAVDAARTLDS